MKYSRLKVVSVAGSLMASSVMLFASSSIGDKIEFATELTTQKVNVPNIVGGSSADIKHFNFEIHNNSNLVLKEIKLTSKFGIKCPKSLLVAGEAMECSFNAKMLYAIICIIYKTRALLQKNITCKY